MKIFPAIDIRNGKCVRLIKGNYEDEIVFNEDPFEVAKSFEKIGSKYQYILIDEFQDTSTLQWNNLIPLVHESLSVGGQNLVVGDAKQAIYRWRNGNVSQFIDLPEIHDPILKDNYESLIDNSFINFLGILDNAAIVSCASFVLLPFCKFTSLIHFSKVTSAHLLINL